MGRGEGDFMKFGVETNLNKCQNLWEQFAPRGLLFDLWAYRFCFYQGYRYQPYFIVGHNQGEPIGILPLWFEKKRSFYTFFGGTFPEPNTFFIKDKSKIGAFLKECPKHTLLRYLAESESAYHPFQENGPSFYLDMSKYNHDVNQLISSFSRKHRKNLRHDLRGLEKRGYTFRYNHLADFEKMIDLNQQRFQKLSDFNEEEMVVSMKQLMQTALSEGKLNLISLIIDGQVEAVELAVIHNRVYYVLCGGHNLEIENIGKPMVIEHIKKALSQNISKLDFLSTESGWKKLWHLATEKLYQFSNK